MLETICSYPTYLVMGGASLIGAMGYAINSIIKKRKADPKWKFDATMLVDTMWQSIAAGVAAGTALGCTWIGISVAIVTGVGIDKIANALKIKDTQILNLLKTASDLLSK